MYQGIAREINAVMPEFINAGAFPSVANIQQSQLSIDALGQVDLTNTGFQTITGCGAVPCWRAPVSTARIVSTQADNPVISEAMNLFHVLLDGYFPQIPQAIQGRTELRAIVDGVLHQVLATEHDGHKTMTRLQCRQVGI